MDSAAFAASAPEISGEGKLFAFTGSFTTQPRKARGEGIGFYEAGGEGWSAFGQITDLVNPSFLVSDAQRGVIYAVHGDSDFASSFQLDRQTGALRQLSRAATGGMNGVHQALSASGQFLLVANYASGSVSVLPVAPDGTLSPFIALLDLPGEPGPHRLDQCSSHPHHIVPDPSGRFFLVPDKGLDCVFVLAFDEETKHLRIASRTVLRPGAGPRHIAFHPHESVAFLVNELESSLALCRWDAASGTLTPRQQLSTLPEDFFGASTAAAVAVTPCGRYIYASNRGQDGIACFSYDSEAKRIAFLGCTPSGGRDPRFVTLTPDGKRLIAANEQGDSIVFFDIDQTSGALTQRGEPLPCLSPSTIAFLSA